MAFDSLAALTLLATSVGTWYAAGRIRAGIRVNLRFAALMLAAFAVASLVPRPALSLATGWLLLDLGATALAVSICFAGCAPVWLASIAFTLAFVSGIASVLSAPLAGFLFQAVADAAILATSMRRARSTSWRSLFSTAGALSLLFGSCVLLDARAGLACLFLAVAQALFARALKPSVVNFKAAGDLPIGGKRAG
ncbi:MAG: hypothetical protein ACREFW_05785 [Rhizomicrobium sp.]